MPKEKIHLISPSCVSIRSCSYCGYEVSGIGKNFNGGLCKRCKKPNRGILIAVSDFYKFKSKFLRERRHR